MSRKFKAQVELRTQHFQFTERHMDEIANFVVVKNAEDQYSIWAADRQIPAGWEPQDFVGPKEACLEYIRTHWVDMTPASLRRDATETSDGS
jgi:MbtH protein